MQQIMKMVFQRIGISVLTLFVLSMLIFFAVDALPGDLAQEILGQTATPETLAQFRKELGLDKPPMERYLGWLGGIMKGDMGRSLANQREIAELIGMRLWNTLFLALIASLIAVPVAVGLGILAALFRKTWFDSLANVFALTAVSAPEFFIAYILIGFFAIRLGWFPAITNIGPEIGFWEHVYRSLLPTLTLTLVVLAQMMRMTRASIINLLASAYIEMARLKGMSSARVILRHALPNALSPIINVVAISLAYLITGVVVVEVVFVYPGLGQLLVDSVSKRDLPVVQACSLIFAVAYVGFNLLADVLSIISNPRLLFPR